METFDPNNQQKYREADYENGLRTIVTVDKEEYRPYPMNSRYLVSNYGTVYDLFTQTKLYPNRIHGGYLRYRLDNDMVLAHRMVAFTFLNDPTNPNYGKMVNHINERKSCNEAWNLEWTNNQANIRYSYQTGSVDGKKGRAHTDYTDEEKHRICKMLEDGYTAKDVADAIGHVYDQNFIRLISKVRTGIRWADISKNYHMPNVRVTAEEVHDICKLLEDGYTAKEISDELGYDLSTSFTSLVSDIRTGKRWKDVSKHYQINPVKTDIATIDRICDLMSQGYSSPEIAKALGVEYDQKFVTFLSYIRTGRSFRNVSQHYPALFKKYTENSYRYGQKCKAVVTLGSPKVELKVIG